MNDILPSPHFNELNLTPEMRDVIIRLPYRVGYWISQYDQTGGDDSEERELQALESIILSYGEDVCKSELTQSIMEQTIAAFDIWPQWHEEINKVPDECRTVSYFLNDLVAPKYASDFCESLFEIAEIVALSYREVMLVEKNIFQKIALRLKILKKKRHANKHKYAFSLNHVLNISPAEEQAMSILKTVLQLS